MGRARDCLGRRGIGLAVLLIGVSGLSCGGRDTGRPVFPVRGQVLLDGKPLPGVLVVFHPLGEWNAEEGRPRAQTDAEGRFTVSTFGTGDGAPPGDYKVTVADLTGLDGETEPQADDVRPRAGRPKPPPGRYANPETSGLRARVAEGANDLEPFRLKAGPRDSAKSSPLPEIE